MGDTLALLLNPLLEPLAFPFMQRGLLAVAMVGVVCAVIGTYVVMKGLAFVGDALAHCAFTGAATAFLVGGNVYLGAAVTGVLSAVAITWVGRTARVPLDTAIGIIFAGVFALGVLMMSRVRNYTVDLFAFVFGNVLGVGPDDLIAIAIMGVLVLLFVLLLYKELLFTAYDPTMAAASGVPVVLLQYLLMIVLGLTTIVTLRAVGIVLAVAMLVTPAATALLLVRRFHHIMLVAVGVSLICAVVGLYLSYYLAVASGAAIVLVTTLAFLLALLFSPQRGLLARSKPSPV